MDLATNTDDVTPTTPSAAPHTGLGHLVSAAKRWHQGHLRRQLVISHRRNIARIAQTMNSSTGSCGGDSDLHAAGLRALDIAWANYDGARQLQRTSVAG